MALLWQRIFLLLHLYSGVFVNTSPIINDNDAEEQYRSQIWSMLNHLNTNPDRQFNYNFNNLLDSLKKTDDVIFINIEVTADCIQPTGCTNAIFNCKGYVERFNEIYETLPGVNCQQSQVTIPDAIPESSTEFKDLPTTQNVNRQKSEYCPGCTVELDTDVPGIENLITTALHHLETEKAKKHISVRVLRLQREIVSGVKFILYLEVAPTICDAYVVAPMCPIDTEAPSQICRIEYIQKPWISNDKHIIANNCTVSQDFSAVSTKKNRNDFDNEIDVNNEYKKSAEISEVVPDSPNYEKMAETGNLEPEISVSRLLELDSQIIPTNPTEHLSVLPLKVEATKFGIDSQLAVEDVPSMPTSTDTAIISESAKPTKVASTIYTSSESEDSTESTESFEERTKRQTTTDSSSSEESDESKLKCNAVPSPAQQNEATTADDTDTTTEMVTGRTDASEREKRSNKDDDNSSSASISDEAPQQKTQKHKKYQRTTCGTNGEACAKDANAKGLLKCKKNSSSSSSGDDNEQNCDNREKRNLEEYTTEKEIVEELAKFAGENLNDDTWKHEVLDIIRVKKLELEGAVYHMVVRFATSRCNEIGECYPFEHDKLCKLMIYYSKDHAKLLKSRCHKIERDADKNPAHQLVKRQALGGPVDARDDPEMLIIAKQSLVQLDFTSSHSHKYKVVKIHNASKQVVSGFSYKLELDIIESDCLKTDDTDSSLCGDRDEAIPKTCHIEVWDQSWLPEGTETNITCGEEKHTFRSKGSLREKRGMKGAPVDSTNEPEMLALAKESLIQLDSQSKHDNKYKIVKIHHASRQIVAGTLYKIQAEIVESDCLKDDKKDSSLCGQKKEAFSLTCSIEIWDRPWLPNGKETTIICGEDMHTFKTKRAVHQRSKRNIPGAPFDATSDPEMISLAKHSIIQLDSRSDKENKYKVIKLHSASKQVVSGMLYKLKVDIIESDCLKNDNKDLSQCGPKKDASVKTCHITIWDQPWLPHGKETNITCDGDMHSFRSKRSLFNKSLQLRGRFREFSQKFGKTYATPEEEDYRFGIFMDNMKRAEELQKNELGTAIYGASRFADLHPAEFKQYLGYRSELRQDNDIPMAQAKIPNIDIPAEFDWRTKGVVTHVKDQGQCGSCWAFSVTGNVEGQYAIKHNKLLEFSEQELVDCDKLDEGCNGGLMDNAYRAIEQLGGLELESDYPYDAEDEKCVYKPSMTRVQLSGAVNVSQNEDDMAKFLVKNGPLSIAINANAMQLYMGGVSHPLKFLCNPNSLDHGVLIVGYGVHQYKLFNKSLPFWIVKNSWGPSWGEQGYYRVYRGDGTCGVNKMVSSALVE